LRYIDAACYTSSAEGELAIQMNKAAQKKYVGYQFTS